MSDPDVVQLTLDLDVPDAYARLTQEPYEVIEGNLQFQTATAVMRLSDTYVQPVSTAAGQSFPATANVSLGPTRSKGEGFRLDKAWFKESSAGAGAVVVFSGLVRRAK